MAKELPFDEDMMALIMGAGDPNESGQHGRVLTPYPEEDAIKLITDIRDQCDEYLRKAGKQDDDESKKSNEDSGDNEIDTEEVE